MDRPRGKIMRRVMLATILAGLFVIDALARPGPDAPQQQQKCRTMLAWHTLLASRFQEEPVAQWFYGGVPVHLYASTSRRTVSILVQISPHDACLVLAGVGFRPTFRTRKQLEREL